MRAFALLSLVLLAGCGLTGGSLVTGRTATGTIVVENQSGHTVDVVLLSRCRNSTYGLNRLSRGESIPTGDARPFTVDAGCWDIGVGVVGYGESRHREEIGAGVTFRYTVTG